MHVAVDRVDRGIGVALKIVYNPEHMLDEILARFNGGQPLDEDIVLGVIRVHVPEQEREKWSAEFKLVDEKRLETGQRPIVAEEPSPDNQYAIVMPLCERSLDQVMGSERLAANDLAGILEVTRYVAKGLNYLHKNGLVHGDMKRKNVMRKSKSKWTLIDMDAAARVGDQLALKYSEAVVPPEYMKVLLPCRTNGRPAKGHPTIQAVIFKHFQH